MDLRTLQNHALRVCYNVRLRDRVSIKNMHVRAKLLSLEQRRHIQILNMMFLYKERHAEVRRVFNHYHYYYYYYYYYCYYYINLIL